MAEPAKVPGGEALSSSSIEDEVEEAIRASGGDARVALQRLLVELEMTRAAVSFGFSRGWHHSRGVEDFLKPGT